MNIKQMAEALNYEIIAGEDSLEREIQSVYTCDLLSFVMGRAPADSAWVTVMGNVNSVAVAALADVTCIVLADGVEPDEPMLQRAKQQDIAILLSPDPIFITAKNIDNLR